MDKAIIAIAQAVKNTFAAMLRQRGRGLNVLDTSMRRKAVSPSFLGGSIKSNMGEVSSRRKPVRQARRQFIVFMIFFEMGRSKCFLPLGLTWSIDCFRLIRLTMEEKPDSLDYGRAMARRQERSVTNQV